jgi:hypothetical protein
VRAEAVARGVTPDQAWAWWTDFREGAEDHAWAAWAKPDRRVQEWEDGSWQVTETATVLRLKFLEVSRIELAKPRLRFDTRNNFGHFWGHYRFLPDAGGTRIEGVWDQELVRWLRWLGPLARFVVRRFFLWDLKHHLRDLEREAARPETS